MVLRNPLDLPAAGRLLALDVGDKRVGVAVCDSARSVALVRGVWERPWNSLKKQIEAEVGNGVVAVVVGLPLNMDGSHGPRAQGAGDLAQLIQKELHIPVLLWDERLTSKAAEAAFFEHRLEGRAGKRQKTASKRDSVGKVDGAAAGLILQGVLDVLRK